MRWLQCGTGNAELGGWSDGAGTMEAIFWGAARWRGNTGYAEPGCILATPEVPNRTNASICDGSTPERSKNCCGPWLGADLESGMCKFRPRPPTSLSMLDGPIQHSLYSHLLD